MSVSATAPALGSVTVSGIARHLPQEQSSRGRMWQFAETKSDFRFRACCEPIMECQDATARIAEYLVGSLRVEELEGLLTHSADCATCRDD